MASHAENISSAGIDDVSVLLSIGYGFRLGGLWKTGYTVPLT